MTPSPVQIAIRRACALMSVPSRIRRRVTAPDDAMPVADVQTRRCDKMHLAKPDKHSWVVIYLTQSQVVLRVLSRSRGGSDGQCQPEASRSQSARRVRGGLC